MFLLIFTSVLMPLLLVAGAGYVFGWRSGFNPRPVAEVAFYLLSPALIYVSLSTSTLPLELLGRLALLKLLLYVILTPLTLVLTDRLKLVGPTASALTLATLFANSGNMGISITEYAFGKEAVPLAVVCYITDNLVLNSLGVFLAARGRASTTAAARQVARNPGLYAAVLGLAARQWGWDLPLPLDRALEMLSRACVPTLLVVLGMQLVGLPLDRRHWSLIGIAAVVRLAVSPLLALALTAPLGLTGIARQVGVLEAAVPTAVLANIVAGRYDAEPSIVAGAVLVSSLASLITLTALLTWMMGWAGG